MEKKEDQGCVNKSKINAGGIQFLKMGTSFCHYMRITGYGSNDQKIKYLMLTLTAPVRVFYG